MFALRLVGIAIHGSKADLYTALSRHIGSLVKTQSEYSNLPAPAEELAQAILDKTWEQFIKIPKYNYQTFGRVTSPRPRLLDHNSTDFRAFLNMICFIYQSCRKNTNKNKNEGISHTHIFIIVSCRQSVTKQLVQHSITSHYMLSQKHLILSHYEHNYYAPYFCPAAGKKLQDSWFFSSCF